jgi:NADH-quinone oxidoreductase subunit C
MSDLSHVLASLKSRFGDKISEPILFRDETTLLVGKTEIAVVAQFLKTDHAFDLLLDISSLDHFGEEPRFEVVYEFYNLVAKAHLRLKLKVSEDDLFVPTLSNVYATADWHEREIYDMMGISFTGHPDLRRILMWEGYPYYPLRKDFPLAGKFSDVPGEAFTKPAPLAGGPFITAPSTDIASEREPRAHPAEI